MTKLITPQEVIDIAFEDAEILPASIKETVIMASQERWIRGALTDELFERMLAGFGASGAEAYSTEEQKLYDEWLKPALAYYVKYTAAPALFTKITNMGAQQPNTEWSRAASKDARESLRNVTLQIAHTTMDAGIRYIKDNIDKFKGYKQASTKRKTLIGGIVFTKKR